MALAASLALHAQAVDNPAANNKADKGQRNTTENAFVFTGSADNQWSNAANWTIGTAKGEIANRIPTANDQVIIDGDCVVATSGEAASITINKGSSLTVQQNSFAAETPFTIKDGGQLFAPAGSENRGTIEKNIRGYGDSRLGNYYFLSMPITDFDLASGFEAAGMFPNGDPNSTDYDLYFFAQNNDVAGEMDQNGDGVIDIWDDYDGLWRGEWQNYKWYINPESDWDVTQFTDEVPNNYAYLNANKENTTLSFNGTFYSGDQTRQCYYVGSADWPGLQLVGNPLPCNASLTFGTRINGFYMINEQNYRRNVVPVEGYEAIVAPATALLAEATSGGDDQKYVTFVPSTENANVRSAKGFVTIEVLSSDGILEDRAYVRDYESEGLSKFSLSNEGAKIYIPQDGKKYAAVSGTGATTLPLCFTTNEGGIHTLTFKVENMDCDYLHLVDNATGADIDLLRTPKYSFNANDCPYATRFKLVFAEEATNDIADNFAFVSNGQLMVNNSGEAILQVMDVAGRVLSTETIRDSYGKSLGLSAGVYVVRLSNGHDVKVQKIVVR